MNCKDCNKLLAEPNPTCAECIAELQAENERLQKCYDVTNQSWKELQAELAKYKPIIALLKVKNGLVKSLTNENCSELVDQLRRISARIDKLLEGLEG